MNRRARRNAARLLGLALVAVSLLLFAGMGSSSADGPGATITAKGWWWEAQADQLPTPLPSPPNVKPGQLNIQNSPTDERGAAFAAVRYAVDAGHTVASLTLNIAENGESGTVVVLACRTGSAWSEADGGSWSTAPNVDDKACVDGTKTTDGTGWTFPVGPLQLGTVLDIAIVPGADPATGQRTPFSLVFNEPTSDSLATQLGSSSSVPPPTFAPSTHFGNTGASAPAGGSVFTPPAGTSFAPALPSDKLGQSATSPAKQAASQPGLQSALATATPAKDRDKRIGYVVLAIAAAVGMYAWRQDSILAGTGGSRVGNPDEPAGLGRFSKIREGQPPALT